MGLLAQLFRHRSASSDGDSTPREAGKIRGLGAIADAIGARPERGMPGEFEISLSELLQRVPAKFIWPGRHDAHRMLRIPAAEIAPGLVRGRAEISLARLVTLAPEVFHWERGESDDPKVRLPIQKLLQQIGAHPFVPAPKQEPPVARHPTLDEQLPSADAPSSEPEIVTAHLPSIVWDQPLIPAAAEPAKPASAARAVTLPAIHSAPADPVPRTVELRPAKDVPISTTLRAVVLGGNAAGSSPDAPSLAGRILAPRTAAPPTVLASADAGPSIVMPAPGEDPPADFAGLQSLFMSSVRLDLPGVAALIAALPGVRACLIRIAAGRAAAGEMPAGLNVEEVRAASEEFARRVGGVESTTLPRGGFAIAIFTRGGVWLSVVIEAAGFVPVVRERLLHVAELLAGVGESRLVS